MLKRNDKEFYKRGVGFLLIPLCAATPAKGINAKESRGNGRCENNNGNNRIGRSLKLIIIVV